MPADQLKKKFDIIRFTACNTRYYPTSMERSKWMGDNYLKHTEINIEIGQSRYGGPVVDMPPEIEYPDNMRFAAQLDLAVFSQFDKTNLLPKTGQLIFFADIGTETGKVVYSDILNEKLIRTIKEHEDNFFDGVLIDKVFADAETMNERFREPKDDWDRKHINAEGKIWNDFAGYEKSKIFGIYTHCQYDQEDIEKITFSDKILLLQVGEGGFNDEGVFSVLISKKDLENKIFDNCEFAWGQS